MDPSTDSSPPHRQPLQPVTTAAPPPYDPLLPSPTLASTQHPPPISQLTVNSNPVPMDTPTETPHDLFCLAKEYERRSRMQDAANLYLKAAMNGHLSAMVCYATHLVPTDERAAFVWFRAAAERGDPRAWYELGQLLARGRYFEVNAVDAARCWKRAAQMGDNTGKSALGLCYIRGFGVKQDLDKGVEIVKQVADVHNDVTAMKNLAWIFRYGKGVPKNLEEAEYWDNRAKEQEKIITHITSREHVLFGRGRSSRHSKLRTRDSEKSSSRPTTRESSVSERATTPDSEPRRSKSRDSSRGPSFKHIAVDELEGRLRDVSDHQKSQSTSIPPHHPDIPYVFVRPLSPNPGTDTNLRDPLAGARENSSTPTETRVYQPFSSTATPRTSASREATVTPTSGEHHYETDNRVQQNPDPVLGAAVADLAFVEKGSELDNSSTLISQSQPGSMHDDPSRMQTVSSARPNSSETLSTSLNQGNGASETPAVAYGAGISAPSGAKDMPHDQLVDEDQDQFETPEESIENGEASPHPGSTSMDMPSNARARVGRNRDDSGEGRENRAALYAHSFDDTDVTQHSTYVSVGTKNQATNQNAASQILPPEDNSALSRVQRAPTFVADPPHSNTLGPTVRSRKEYFDKQHAEMDDDMSPHVPGQLRKEHTYAIGSATASHGSKDLHEFEDADLQRISSTVAEAGENNGADTPVTQTESVPATPRDGVPSNAATQDTDVLSPGDGNTVPRAGLSDDSSLFYTLKQSLSSYPQNPMRADSQGPLLKLLVEIQDFPVASGEAYAVIEEGAGFFKVVVAMISHHENENIQENGLHSLVRIMRATMSSKREDIALASYADCFRAVQRKADVVVPKGTNHVDESNSGAVQAILLAMHRHATVRRIQLAGCAALAEIVSISESCRSVSYKNGAVNPLVACLRHRSSTAAAAIHDLASRAVANFCSGKESIVFKEAFTNAGTVSELLGVLQLWGHSEEEPTDLMLSATTSCCGALRHLADAYPVASIQCIQSFAYHHLVRVMALRRTNATMCTVVLSTMTSITRGAGSAAEKAILDAKPLSEVLLAMQVHTESSLFIRKALDFLEALGSFSKPKEEIVVAGGIPFTTDIIRQGGNDSLLLERSCGVIEKLCRLSPPNQEIFGTANGVQCLTALLDSHQRNSGVVERALIAMSSVCTNNAANQRVAVRSKSPEELVRVLGVYSSKNAKVVSAAAGAMCALVVPKNVPVAQTFAGLKAPELIVRAMKRHPDSVMVQEHGSAAIAAFCEADPHIMTSLLKSGITTILVVALQRFLHKQTAVVQIVRAMRAITNDAVPEDSYRFKSKLLTDRSNESSLPEIFHTALSYHKKSLPETANVIISICATINRLCMRSVAFKNEVGRDGIVEELKRLVERTAEYKELGALQPVLATICTLVLESEENKNRFHSVGGVEAVLDVMQKWKHDTYVLEHCCAALRYSCNDHFGNCDEVKNHNGVRSILGVMEMHPENVNVTLWCCLTLADLCKEDEELQSSATVVQGIRKVVSAMNVFSQNSRFLASACEFLRAAASCNDDNKERIVRLGGRSAIVKALETHPTDNTLTEAASYALLHIQNIQDPRASTDSLPPGGAVKRLSRDLRRSGSSSNRSNRSSKGKMGRKSTSFTNKKRDAGESEMKEFEGRVVDEEVDEDTEQRQDVRPVKTSSLTKLRRLRLIPRSLSRHSRPSDDMEEDMDEDVDVREDLYHETYDLGYNPDERRREMA